MTSPRSRRSQNVQQRGRSSSAAARELSAPASPPRQGDNDLGGALIALGLVVAGYMLAPEIGRAVAAVVRRPRRPPPPPVDLSAKYPGAIDV